MQIYYFQSHSFNQRHYDHSDKRYNMQDFILKSFQAEHVDVIFINAQRCTGRKWVLADWR